MGQSPTYILEEGIYWNTRDKNVFEDYPFDTWSQYEHFWALVFRIHCCWHFFFVSSGGKRKKQNKKKQCDKKVIILIKKFRSRPWLMATPRKYKNYSSEAPLSSLTYTLQHLWFCVANLIFWSVLNCLCLGETSRLSFCHYEAN